MARIPIANELGNVGAQTPASVARVSTPQLARPQRQVPSFAGINIGRGVSALGTGISNIGIALERKQQQDDAIDLVRAEAHQKKSLIEARRDLENDPDYATYGERFDKRAAKFDQESAKLIRNPELREKWELQASVRTEAARDQILRAGVKKDRQAKQTSLVESLESHRDIYIAPGSDSQKVQARADMEAAIIASERTGLISPSQALRLRKQFIEGSAKADAEVQLRTDPESLKDDLQGKGTFRRWLEGRESSGDPGAVNAQQFAGLYQFGAPRLSDLGLYKAGTKEVIKNGWSGEKWSGEFNIPGHPEVKTLADFLASPDAQRKAFNAQIRQMDREILNNNLGRFIGQTVGGVTITQESLYGMIHLGGPGGAKAALESGGKINPVDANGTSVLDYAAQAGTTSRYGGLDTLEKSRLLDQAVRRITTDPDLVAERRALAKTGYDMLFNNNMDREWLEANRDTLNVRDYRAFLRGLRPENRTRKTEPKEYLRLFDQANEDPRGAINELRTLYANDLIAKDDFNRLFNLAQRNEDKRIGRDYSNELRTHIKSQLRPGRLDPPSHHARRLDAMFQFDDWLEANPNSGRDEQRKAADQIVSDFKRIRYTRGITEIPLPRFVKKKREDIDEPDLELAKQALIEAVRAGELNKKEAATQAALLRRWFALIRNRE